MRNKIIQLCLIIVTTFNCAGPQSDPNKVTHKNDEKLSEYSPVNSFQLNHIGFPPNASKYFVIENPPEKIFQILEIREDVIWHKVYEDELEKKESELPGEWIGDFSQITKQGMYRIRCGNKDSRPFVIYDKVYDMPQRTLLNYFTWQRCGSKKGWAGECHLDDGIIRETDEYKNFSGGYHQSCDLRKSLDGVAIGVIGMIKYALLEKPHWDEGIIAEEIKWACDYYMKLIHPNGFMYDGLFIPFGWEARYYYNKPAAPSEQWNSLRLLALGSQYFQKYGDIEYASKCLSSALRIWDFMLSDSRPDEAYQPPEPIPRGLNALLKYDLVFKGSADDIEFQLLAAAALYRASKELKFLNEMADCADRLCDLQIGEKEMINEYPVGACFWVSADSCKIAGMRGSYTTNQGIGLCEAIEIMPDRQQTTKWREALEKIVIQYQVISDRNIWGQIPYSWAIKDKKDLSDSYQAGYIEFNSNRFPCFYSYGRRSNTKLSRQGILLNKAAKVFNKPELKGLAQRQADWILGGNPFDASSVTGVGFNQPYLPVFGQFFPHTPQIPGAVIVGVPDGVEYDMPCVGTLMWLLAEISTSD